MKAATKAGIKRVVITSSFASVLNPKEGGGHRDYTYTDKDWNPLGEADALKPGTPAQVVYMVSKTMAEQAAWDYQKSNPELEVVTILPPRVYGPGNVSDPVSTSSAPHQPHNLQQAINNSDSINTSSNVIYQLVTGNNSEPNTPVPQFIDVRDVGLAHVKALTVPKAANHRFLIYGGTFTWTQVMCLGHIDWSLALIGLMCITGH